MILIWIKCARRPLQVNEEAGTVDITVQRRGNLNEYAIVLCRTEHGTATSSTDGRLSQAGAVDYMEHAAQVRNCLF